MVGVRVYKNTYVQTTAPTSGGRIIPVELDKDTPAGQVDFYDNIVYLPRTAADVNSIYKRHGSYHYRNILLFRTPEDSPRGYCHLYNDWDMTLGPAEIRTDPMFTNVAGSDFTLRSGSPAVGKGAFP